MFRALEYVLEVVAFCFFHTLLCKKQKAENTTETVEAALLKFSLSALQ